MKIRAPRPLRRLGINIATELLGAKRVAAIKTKRRLDASLIPTELARIPEMRIAHRVAVDQPMLLVSQIQRSGGTLLSQLFDSHPECHAHPYELYVGYPDKYTWPSIDLAAGSDTWFQMLFERPVLKASREGYRKYSKAGDHEFKAFPFVFLPALQKAIFDACVRDAAVASARDVFDCYMTSYFNAWLDNQNLYGPRKKLITAFVPRLHMQRDSLRRFFADYPDGRFVSIVRDPLSWFASARKHSPSEYSDIAQSTELWSLSTTAALEAKRDYGERVRLIRFDSLLQDTEKTMRGLAAWADLTFSAELLTPTFNRYAIKADSSFRVERHGIINEPLHQFRRELEQADIEAIQSKAQALYETARTECE